METLIRGAPLELKSIKSIKGFKMKQTRYKRGRKTYFLRRTDGKFYYLQNVKNGDVIVVGRKVFENEFEKEVEDES